MFVVLVFPVLVFALWLCLPSQCRACIYENGIGFLGVRPYIGHVFLSMELAFLEFLLCLLSPCMACVCENGIRLLGVCGVCVSENEIGLFLRMELAFLEWRFVLARFVFAPCLLALCL